MTYRILVTGSRSWAEPHELTKHLGQAIREAETTDIVIVHGACPAGADAIADRFAIHHGIRAERHPARWRVDGRYNPRAGFDRNAEMVNLGANLCLAFIAPCTDRKCRIASPHGSHGASHCACLAEQAGIPVRRHP